MALFNIHINSKVNKGVILQKLNFPGDRILERCRSFNYSFASASGRYPKENRMELPDLLCESRSDILWRHTGEVLKELSVPGIIIEKLKFS